ncbi:MAG TPA: TrkH family potassium uptake protein [Longimicrobiales bacterium]|nr:TrkH family potassium uptake protein [Longimicrobiales bacterium]
MAEPVRGRLIPRLPPIAKNPPSRGHVSLADVSHLVCTLLLGVAGAMALAAVVGLMLRDGSFAPLAIATLATAVVGAAGRGLTHVPQDINFREAFLTVTFAWTAVAIFGALPYLLSNAIPVPAEALFESMSGFTTTGSSVLADIEAVQPGILFWRSLTQWLGGMGFIVLGVAILPYLGVGGMQLFRLEAPGPTADRLRPRIRETAKLLWMVYAGLTVLLAFLFVLGGMSVFEAVNHALTTMPTGGFSTRNASMAAFSPYIQWVTIVFMFLAGTSFTLHYRSLARSRNAYVSSSEWRLYTAIILVAAAIIATLTYAPGAPLEQTIRDATFQVVSIITTTGFGSADYVLWAPAAQILLFLLFFLGGMAGSTSGGMKMIRVLLVLKHAWMEVRKQLHPRAVFVPKVGGRPVHEHIMLNVLGFVLIYMMLFGVGTFAIAMLGYSLPASAGAAATAISNVGPALAELGPTANFSDMQWQGDLVLTFLMLVGRLEIYTVLLLFHPALWRGSRSLHPRTAIRAVRRGAARAIRR